MTSGIDVTEKDITSQGVFLQKMEISFYILDIVKDKATILNTLVGRFGRFDLNVQKDKTYRFGSAKQQ